MHLHLSYFITNNLDQLNELGVPCRKPASAEGGPAVSDRAEIESQAAGKRSECVHETEVSGESEKVEMWCR